MSAKNFEIFYHGIIEKLISDFNFFISSKIRGEDKNYLCIALFLYYNCSLMLIFLIDSDYQKAYGL